VQSSVEAMRGLEIEYAHNPNVKGVVRSVAKNGDVVIH